MQELLWMVVNNCNVEAAKKNPLFIRCPFLESVITFNFINGLETWLVNDIDKKYLI